MIWLEWTLVAVLFALIALNARETVKLRRARRELLRLSSDLMAQAAKHRREVERLERFRQSFYVEAP